MSQAAESNPPSDPTPAPPLAGLSPGALSAIAARVYTQGPLLLRLLQTYRPYICPFESVLKQIPPGSTVLDVGCGGGLLLALLASTGRTSRAVGFDSALPAIQIAQAAADRNGLHQCRFIHLDVAAPWPAEPPTFDAVTIIDVLHHVPTAAQRQVIATAAGRVGPGGRLVYKDMCRRPWWRAWANRLHDLLLARQWIAYCPIEDVERWASEAGLKLIHRADLNRWWYGHELRVFQREPRA